MIEETITDSLGATIELIYETEGDVVKVKNSAVDLDFREVKRLAMFNPNVNLGFETLNNEDDRWGYYSTQETRDRIRLFWETNKVNKD